MIGYILRQHPSWIKFIEIARELGTPLVFRMNLNQQSNGETWEWHKRLHGFVLPRSSIAASTMSTSCAR